MDQLAAMRVFVAVVDEQGFSAASRALPMPLPTVCRKIAELEQHLGAQLLVRTTRKVTVTDAGRRYYEDVVRILEDLGEAEQQVSGEYQTPKGRLTVTAPTLFGRLHVLPIAIDFMKAHDDVDLQLVLTNSVLDLVEDHIDLGVRIGPLSNTTLTTVETGSMRQIVCGSPGYLASNPCPKSPSDLMEHRCATFSTTDSPNGWLFKTPSGQLRRFPVRNRLTLNSIEGLVQAAAEDFALAQFYAYQAAPQIADGRLKTVLQDYEIDPVPVSLIYPQGRRIPQKLRAFVDFTRPRLQERLSLVAQQCLAI